MPTKAQLTEQLEELKIKYTIQELLIEYLMNEFKEAMEEKNKKLKKENEKQEAKISELKQKHAMMSMEEVLEFVGYISLKMMVWKEYYQEEMEKNENLKHKIFVLNFEAGKKCFREQTRIGECPGCKNVYEECERLLIGL